MSLKENYLQHITSERTRLHDAIIPTEVKPKPQKEKLCTFCKRAMMEPYLRPDSRFIDENGKDNGGMFPGKWYWRCYTCGEHYEMPTQQETTKRGYKQKNPITSKLSMHLGTYNRITQSWDKRKKRKSLSGEEEEDINDISNWLGYTPQSVEVVDSREYHYDGRGLS
jgi:hypothetical protein